MTHLDAQQGTGLRIAVVDDEPDIRNNVATALQAAGLEVETHADGDLAAASFEDRLPDLAVLDIMLPGVDGLELCRRLRAHSPSLPILFLTSRDEEFDRVLGLELGADDYLCKPFSLRELVARVRVLVRRLRLLRAADEGAAAQPRKNNASSSTHGSVNRGPLSLDLDRYQATLHARALALTITEFRILHALAEHPGHVLSRTRLIESAYPEDRYKSERTIDTHIKRLRAKLVAHDDGAVGLIETVYGAGYRLGELSPDDPPR